VCGIAGWVVPDRAPIDEPALVAMTNALAHRGPDGEGIHLEPGCGLGHRRLSLIDRRGSAQPMQNEGGAIWIVANNEIYNYIELRDSLLTRGHRFTTAGDTEVLVHLYEDLGERCVEPLIGMFAFAVWDRTERTLFLARDRFGIKPLYYTIDGDGGLRFASELRALLCGPGIDRTLDLAAMREYLRHLTVPESSTIFRAVRKLPAGHYLTWHEGEVRVRRYWNLPERRGGGLSMDDAAQELDSRLADSTALTIRSDEPVGLFLSGGLDSGTLAWMMRRCGMRPLRTFSVAFADPQFDESRHSRSVAAEFGCEHTEVNVSKDEAAAVALELVDWFDEPFADSSALPTYILSREARRSVKAVLSGEGADELFGGSVWHDPNAPMRPMSELVAPPAKVVFPDDMLQAVFSADGRVRLDAECYDPFAALARDMPDGLDRLHQQLYADLMVYLPSDLLAKIDRMSMLNSLEARVPYLNHPLAEFVWQLPAVFKHSDGVRKRLLRVVAQAALPAPILARSKQGFAIPMDAWLWEPGRFRDAVYDTLRGSRCRSRGWLDHRLISKMLDEHDRPRRLHGYRLWTLFVLEHWLERHQDGQSSFAGAQVVG
jgi:asparagine synthase (glutamine-hydrolysing)